MNLSPLDKSYKNMLNITKNIQSKKLILLIILISFFSCKKNEKKEYPEVEKEIKALKSKKDKRVYLEKILEDDQKVRGNEGQELMKKYGKGSREYINFINLQWEVDEINLFKIEEFLKIHGYPSKELGRKATTAVWIVIHHAQSYDARIRNFDKIYEAYLKGNIDDSAISLYLGRMYQIKEGKRLQIKSPFQSKDEINLLIKELKLEEKKEKVKQNLSKINKLPKI